MNETSRSEVQVKANFNKASGNVPYNTIARRLVRELPLNTVEELVFMMKTNPGIVINALEDQIAPVRQAYNKLCARGKRSS